MTKTTRIVLIAAAFCTLSFAGGAYFAAAPQAHAVSFPYQLPISIPDQATYDRLVNDFGADWPATIDDGSGNMVANPQSKAAFAKDKLIKYIKNYMVNYERSVASSTDPGLS